ncbi:MAG TPA: hypothetical protein VMR37_06790, partial [Rhabdochlamydiaceae bacterium]|nr:hypothetical protein [Rhabdochlamydiaceae bacterium]
SGAVFTGSIVGPLISTTVSHLTESLMTGNAATLIAFAVLSTAALPFSINRISESDVYYRHGEVFNNELPPVYHNERELYYRYLARQCRRSDARYCQYDNIRARVFDSLISHPLIASADLEDQLLTIVSECTEDTRRYFAGWADANLETTIVDLTEQFLLHYGRTPKMSLLLPEHTFLLQHIKNWIHSHPLIPTIGLGEQLRTVVSEYLEEIRRYQGRRYPSKGWQEYSFDPIIDEATNYFMRQYGRTPVITRFSPESKAFIYYIEARVWDRLTSQPLTSQDRLEEQLRTIISEYVEETRRGHASRFPQDGWQGLQVDTIIDTVTNYFLRHSDEIVSVKCVFDSLRLRITERLIEHPNHLISTETLRSIVSECAEQTHLDYLHRARSRRLRWRLSDAAITNLADVCRSNMWMYRPVARAIPAPAINPMDFGAYVERANTHRLEVARQNNSDGIAFLIKVVNNDPEKDALIKMIEEADLELYKQLSQKAIEYSISCPEQEVPNCIKNISYEGLLFKKLKLLMKEHGEALSAAPKDETKIETLARNIKNTKDALATLLFKNTDGIASLEGLYAHFARTNTE